MSEQIDPKVMAHLARLLNVTTDRGYSETEAKMATTRSRKMMDDLGLTTAQVEAAGGTGERRQDANLDGNAGEWWQPPLMKALAEASYVYVEHYKKADAAGRELGAGYRLIGRLSAVATCRVMYDYLVEVVVRCSREAAAEHKREGKDFKKKWFRRGMSERLVERIRSDHEKALRQQKAEADATVAAQAAAGGTGNALVVTLVDYQQREKELNNDLLHGLPPGTTTARREKRERESREYDERREAQRAELKAQGVPDDIIQYVMWGYTLAEAEKIIADQKAKVIAPPKPPKEQTARQREQEEARRRRYWDRHYAKQDAEDRRRASSSWRSGREAGDSASLNQQVDERAKSTRRLT